jgi:hypothetical protein
VNSLTRCVEHPGHRVLSKPIDLDIRVDLSQFLGDRQVTASVAKPDR